MQSAGGRDATKLQYFPSDGKWLINAPTAVRYTGSRAATAQARTNTDPAVVSYTGRLFTSMGRTSSLRRKSYLTSFARRARPPTTTAPRPRRLFGRSRTHPSRTNAGARRQSQGLVAMQERIWTRNDHMDPLLSALPSGSYFCHASVSFTGVQVSDALPKA